MYFKAIVDIDHPQLYFDKDIRIHIRYCQFSQNIWINLDFEMKEIMIDSSDYYANSYT